MPQQQKHSKSENDLQNRTREYLQNSIWNALYDDVHNTSQRHQTRLLPNSALLARAQDDTCEDYYDEGEEYVCEKKHPHQESFRGAFTLAALALLVMAALMFTLIVTRPL